MFTNRRIQLFFSVLILASLACNLPTKLLDNQSDENNTVENTVSVPVPTNTSEVIAPTIEIPVPQVTDTPTVTVESPTAIPTEVILEDCVNDSEFVSDITVPDGTLLVKGVEITKTWQILNDGTCTWTPDYHWSQIGGGVLYANIGNNPLSQNVAPGETLDISVVIQLSAASIPGNRYHAQFQMHDPDGLAFGTHPFALVFASPGTAVCPVAFSDYLTYVSASDGFCMFYPDTYSMNNSFADPDRIGVSFSSPHPGGGGEVMLTTLGINLEGAAGGQTSEEFANLLIEDWKIPGSLVSATLIDLDGTDAYFTDDLPGMVRNRIIFTVHNNIAYVMTLMPMDDAFLTETAETGEFYDLLLSSFTWINP